MSTLSYAQLESIWLQASQGTKYHSQAWASLMAAIAMAESGGNPDITNPNDNGGTQTSWGLWQISLGNHSAPSPAWNNPVTNAQLAIGKLNSQGLGAWGTYDSGAYKQYYNGAVPPGGGGSGTSTATLTSWNPLTWVTSPIKGLEWAGSFITGTAGGGLSGLQSIADVATGIAGLVRSVNKAVELFLMLFRPAFWLRVGAFFVGLLALLGSLYFLKEAI